MKKFFIQSILLLIVTFGSMYYWFTAKNSVSTTSPTRITNSQNVAFVKGVPINIEIADSPDERKKGLGGRQSLATDSGMLFIFEKEGIQTFWMKGLNFPLDFIWIRSGKVVDITKNAQPPAPNTPDQNLSIYVPREPVTSVLEVNSGFVDANNIRIGDKIEVQR